MTITLSNTSSSKLTNNKSDQIGFDTFIIKIYKIICTIFTGIIVQCRFRWLESLFYNSLNSVVRYVVRPLFMYFYLIDLFRPTLPTCHLKWLPYSINRILLSEEPCLDASFIDPSILCNKFCDNKRIIIYVNGSYMNREIFNDSLKTVSDMFILPCFGFYNPTSGIFVDTFMDVIQRFTDFNSYKAYEFLNSVVYLTNEYQFIDEIVILAHGSGGLIAEQFLRLLRELKYKSSFINKFKFILVGSPVCRMKWTRDEHNKLISYTGEQLYEKTDIFGNKQPHKAYYKSKFYCNLCCDEDHSESVPYPYIESIYNSSDLVACAGIANNSKLCQSDMIDIDGIKIEIPDMYGHYNYHHVTDHNYQDYCRSYLARDYNIKYSGHQVSN